MTALIAIDAGNSRISTGVFDKGELKLSFHFPVKQMQEATAEILEKAKEHFVCDIAISSVVPQVSEELSATLKGTNLKVYRVSTQSQNILKGVYPTLGSDRLANACAAYRLHLEKHDVAIVLDFGTATTLTAVDSNGNFLGGLITLGLGSTLLALNKSTGQLPGLTVNRTLAEITPFATDTESAMQNGCILAQVGIVEQWIRRAKESAGGFACRQDASAPSKVKVIATGGWAPLIVPHSQSIDHADPDLTLKGIKFIAEAAGVLRDRG